jgi:NhaP-type Na+/H+ or K+/H+ antiporter
LGAILAPTDAALGLPIFNNPRVPVRIRRALNIESGLNDGIATPFVLLFLAFAVSTEAHTSGTWLESALIEILLAIAAGIAVGGAGGWLLERAERHGWTAGEMEQLAIMGLALAAYFCSLTIGGNGFIAAFVGGIVFRAATRGRFVEPTEFAETFGSFLSLLVWMVFGAVLVARVLQVGIDWHPILYAILSLTVIRMLPVALALRGTGLRRDTVALMGWFGPRGLASVVFSLIAFESFQEAGRPIDTLIMAATWTILLSVLAHGLSATPLSIWYARRLEAAPEPPAELADMPELRQRRRMLAGSAKG